MQDERNTVEGGGGERQGAGTSMVCLFKGPFVVRDGVVAPVAVGGRRLLALIALREGRVGRRAAARALWPGMDDDRAAGRLRTALWRLRDSCDDVIAADTVSIALRQQVDVDVAVLGDWAARLVAGTATPSDLTDPRPGPDQFELLPDWTDPWIVLARERSRQRLLHGVEALCAELMAIGRGAEAIDMALVGVSVDPLRESAQKVLVSAYLAEHNVAAAKRTFDDYRELLAQELGVRPSREFAALLQGPPG